MLVGGAPRSGHLAGTYAKEKKHMDKDKLIVAQNCNSATATVMAALVNAGAFTYEDVRANWGDLHQIINENTHAAAGAQMVAQAFPETQTLSTPPPAPAAPQTASTSPSAPASKGKGGWIREDAFETITGAIEFERMSGITFGSGESNFFCNQVSKETGQLPNGTVLKNPKSYPHAKVKRADYLKGDWAQALAQYAEHAIDFDSLPASFTRPAKYVK